MRRVRRSLDLTQHALAQRASCSPQTIKKIENGERRPSRSMAAALAHALGLPDEDRARFVEAGCRDGRPVDARAHRRVRTASAGRPELMGDRIAVPLWNSFVGRSHDIDGVLEQLGLSRLVAITGPGGVGKSRLAAEVARQWDGAVVWVELKQIESAEQVDVAVANALDVRAGSGARARNAIISRLDGTWLVVLDNCEHVIDEVSELCQDLLAECPALSVLVASRVVALARGEARWPLVGLTTDPNGEGAGRSEAADLFEDRARAVAPSWAADDRSRAAVDAICERFDGLPLAIELAAARSDVYPPAVLVERIHADAEFLTVPSEWPESRYRNLAEMVLWSLRLLSADEQHCLTSLSVFAGVFDAAAAHAIAGSDVELTVFEERLRALVGASLVGRSDPERAEYHLLETIRSIVRERADRVEYAEARDRHARWFADVAEASSGRLWGPDAPAVLHELARHHADFESAIDWTCISGSASTAARLCGHLARYWDLRGHVAAGLRASRRAARLAGHVDAPTAAIAANGLGTLAMLAGEPVEATEAFERAVSIASAAGLAWSHAYALSYLGVLAGSADDAATARLCLHAADAIAERAREPGLQGWTLIFLGATELHVGDVAAAESIARRARELLVRLGDDEGSGWACIGLAGAQRLRGRPDTIDLVLEGLGHFERLHAGWGISVAAVEAGMYAVHRGQVETASILLTLGDELRRVVGAIDLPVFEAWRGQLAHATGGSPTIRNGGDTDERPLLRDSRVLIEEIVTRARALGT